MTILSELQKHAAENPEKLAVIEGKNEVTYAQLWDRIVRASSYYRTVGKKGDRVVLAANKSVDFVYSYFGAQLAGLITVTVDSAVNRLRLERIFASAEPVAMYGSLDTAYEGFLCEPFPELEHCGNDGCNVAFPMSDDPADILYTTGTTGFPKGVVLSHSNELCAATMINAFIRNNEHDVELLALPISHSFGLGRLRCTLLRGATIDLLGSFANMKRFFREMDERQITGFGMVPASWNYIKRMSGSRIGNYAAQLRYIEIGSAPMKLEDKKLLVSLLPNTRICMHYGLTEASRSAFICFNEEQNHLDSIGHPSPGVEIRVLDENGAEVENGQNGELCVRGGHVCTAYWGADSARYPESFFGDYFRTGDWGYVDETGYYHLISRQKELINVGGKKVSPIEVEEVINTLEDVEECACVGMADDVLGEVVKAFVVRSSEQVTEEKIIRLVKSRLEGYKVPASVEFIAEVPKTSSGKIQRLSLK